MRKLMVVAAASLLASAACVRAGARQASGVYPSNEPVRVHVTNNYALAMEIYASGGGTYRRLGLVYPGMPTSFEVPPAMLTGGGEVEFTAQPSGHGQTFRAFPVTLAPGDVVDFVIMTNLIGSHADVAFPRLR